MDGILLETAQGNLAVVRMRPPRLYIQSFTLIAFHYRGNNEFLTGLKLLCQTNIAAHTVCN